MKEIAGRHEDTAQRGLHQTIQGTYSRKLLLLDSIWQRLLVTWAACCADDSARAGARSGSVCCLRIYLLAMQCRGSPHGYIGPPPLRPGRSSLRSRSATAALRAPLSYEMDHRMAFWAA